MQNFKYFSTYSSWSLGFGDSVTIKMHEAFTKPITTLLPGRVYGCPLTCLLPTNYEWPPSHTFSHAGYEHSKILLPFLHYLFRTSRPYLKMMTVTVTLHHSLSRIFLFSEVCMRTKIPSLSVGKEGRIPQVCGALFSPRPSISPILQTVCSRLFPWTDDRVLGKERGRMSKKS